MKKLLFLLFLIPIISFGQENYKLYEDYLPSSKCGEVIHYKYYSVSYCDENKISEWSIHNVSKESLKGTAPRQKSFTLDDKGRGATSDDYRHSGYDRGHLVPAADMKLTETSSREVAYMTNMTPQQPVFNRGIWLFLESKLREKTIEWANDKANLTIISGQFGKIAEIGWKKNKIPIPQYFYKIAFDITENRAIAFLIPNKKGRWKKLENYVVSISYLEKLTGIDFFYKLDSFTQFQLEKLETKLVEQNTYSRVLSDDKKESKVVTINNYNKKEIPHYLKNVEVDPKKLNSIYSKAVTYSNIKSRSFFNQKKMVYGKLNDFNDSQSYTNSKTSVDIKNWFYDNIKEDVVSNKREALVIGNTNYKNDRLDLKNPVNDASLMKKSLVELGFNVKLKLDLDKSELFEELKDFQLKQKESDLSIIYYAGHAFQDENGNSYLIPTDLSNDNNFENDAVAINPFLNYYDNSDKPTLFILDACRDTNNEGLSRPLIKDPLNIKLSYSTSFGKTASENENRMNTIYTSALSKMLLLDGLTVQQIFHNTSKWVKETTNENQVPANYFGLNVDDLQFSKTNN